METTVTKTEVVKKKRGRPKRVEGETVKKPEVATSIIEDPLLHPYKIYVDANQYSIVNVNDSEKDIEKSYGYFTSLGNALLKIVRLKTTKRKTYTLPEYVKEVETLIKQFKEKFNA